MIGFKRLFFAASCAALLASNAIAQPYGPGPGVGINALTGDVTASGQDSVPATVNSYNGGTPFGTAAAASIGTSGAAVPVLNGNNTFSGSNAYGTPASITLTNGTGLPIGSGVSGLGTGVAAFLATPTSANLAAALTDETGTGMAVFGTAPTITGLTNNGNGAASTSVSLFSGTLFSGGNGTTTLPKILDQPTGTSAASTWSTAGTVFGVNEATGFAGSFLDFHIAGASSKFNVDQFGDVTSNGSVFIGGSGNFGFTARAKIFSPADSKIELTATSGAGFTILQFGGATASFGAIQTNGTETDSELADGSAAAPFGAIAYVARGSIPALTGTCTTASQTGGNTAGTFAATCTAGTVIITFATTAPTGWNCNVHDQTTPADALNQTASSATTCTLTGTTVASDRISFNAAAF